jgi:hypothetical protein
MESVGEAEVYRFLYEKIDTIPHLEALLQLWQSRPRKWDERDLAQGLFVSTQVLRGIMQDLAGLHLVFACQQGGQWWYCYQSPSPRTDALVGAVAETYKVELLRVTAAIHSKASSGAREFGRAFQFKKGTR